MHPDLFKIGPLTVHTYGVAMAAAFLVGFWLSALRAPREQLDTELVLDSFLPLFLGAMLGARALFIITDWRPFAESPIRILKVWEGGLVFYGGFLGGMVGVLAFVKSRDISFWRLMDLFAPYAGLGYAIHRTFGCFMGNGCCYGKPTSLPWGVIYPSESPPYSDFGLQPVHPTQLYEAINGLIIMAVLMAYRRRNHRIGQPSGIFLIIYSILRFGIEFLRGDIVRGFMGPLSTSQWISIPMFIAGVALLLRKTPVLEPLDEEGAKKFEAEQREKGKEVESAETPETPPQETQTPEQE